jgi:hypothetical protein
MMTSKSGSGWPNTRQARLASRYPKSQKSGQLATLFESDLSQLLFQFMGDPSEMEIAHAREVMQTIQNCGMGDVQSFGK